MYVQKVDLEFLKYRLHSLPQSISVKTFENSEIDIDDYHKYDFFQFEGDSDIQFFKSTDWIIDYDSVKNLTISEIKEIGKGYLEKQYQLSKVLYTIDSNNQNYESILLQYTLVNFKISTLNDILDFKSGLLKFDLPGDGSKFHHFIKTIFPKKR